MEGSWEVPVTPLAHFCLPFISLQRSAVFLWTEGDPGPLPRRQLVLPKHLSPPRPSDCAKPRGLTLAFPALPACFRPAIWQDSSTGAKLAWRSPAMPSDLSARQSAHSRCTSLDPLNTYQTWTPASGRWFWGSPHYPVRRCCPKSRPAFYWLSLVHANPGDSRRLPPPVYNAHFHLWNPEATTLCMYQPVAN